jgi:hypothetical protein
MTQDFNMMWPMRIYLIGPLIGLALVAAGVVQGQTPGPFKRGEVVRVQDVKEPAGLKIVGLPDEIVEANETGVYIDDVAVTGFSPAFLSRHRLPRQYIPMDHYFVMGEERLDKAISEHLGIHPTDRIERAQ